MRTPSFRTVAILGGVAFALELMLAIPTAGLLLGGALGVIMLAAFAACFLL